MTINDGLGLVLAALTLAGTGVAFGVARAQISAVMAQVEILRGQLERATEKASGAEIAVKDVERLQKLVDRLDGENRKIMKELGWNRRGSDLSSRHLLPDVLPDLPSDDSGDDQGRGG